MGVLVGGSVVPPCKGNAIHKVIEVPEVGRVSPDLECVLWVEVQNLGTGDHYIHYSG